MGVDAGLRADVEIYVTLRTDCAAGVSWPGVWFSKCKKKFLDSVAA
jgi:hypothetical protein